jgi:hypothetical protein
MSRTSGGDAIVVKPTNNVYTVLVAVAIVVEIVGIVALWFEAIALQGKPLFP